MFETKLDSAIPAILAAWRAEAGKAALASAERIADHARAEMRAGKSGRLYGAHRASAPGEAPAVLTGALIGSLAAEQTGPTEAAAYAADEKAPRLEYGNGRVAARPFLQPAAAAERSVFEAAIAAILGRTR